MLTLFKNGSVYMDGRFETADVLTANRKIVSVVPSDSLRLTDTGLEIETVEAKGHYIIPGFIDSQLMLSGGSGESGFLSQSPRISIEECVRGGITTVVGTLGVDTITKTMSQLYACVRGFREAGMGAFAYSGGYEIPPRTLTSSLREDLLFVDEIIGAGEVAIADRRAPEPSPRQLARVVTDAYVGGVLSGKAGVTRVHVGEGKRRLQTLRDLLEQFEIKPEGLYLTHIERSRELVVEGIELARRGCFLDFDIHHNDLQEWYSYYIECNGPLDRLSFSSDAGVSSPAEMWDEVKKCTLLKGCAFEKMIPHMTAVPAKALKLDGKGHIRAGFDADLLVVEKKDLHLRDVMAGGKFFMRNTNLHYEDQAYTARRGLDRYGIRR